MIVFKAIGDQGETLTINFCEKGIYIEIEFNENFNEMANVIIDLDDAKELIKYIQDGIA